MASIHLSIYLSIYVSIYLSILVYLYLYMYICIYTFIIWSQIQYETLYLHWDNRPDLQFLWYGTWCRRAQYSNPGPRLVRQAAIMTYTHKAWFNTLKTAWYPKSSSSCVPLQHHCIDASCQTLGLTLHECSPILHACIMATGHNTLTL